EEKSLPRCLKSVSSIADEIIVVDTGSEDKTVDIAKYFKAKVYHHKWSNNFSEARNFAIDKCSKDWIFIIDADEELSPSHAKALKNRLDNCNDKEAFYLRLLNFIDSVAINETPSLRIFRNKPEYRYSGRLHEQIFFSIDKNNTGNAFETTDFILNHYGYDHNNVDMNSKTKRNIEILEGTPLEDRDGFFYFSFGSEYVKLNDILNAKECFIKAIETPSKDYGFKPYLSVNLAKTCLTLKEYKSGLDYIEKFTDELPGFKDLYFLEASLYYELMEFSKSYESLNTFIRCVYNPKKYPRFNFDETNDINGLLNAIKSLSLPKIPNPFITIINLNHTSNNLENVIKNANEISSEVIVLSEIDVDKNLENTIYECGAKLLYARDTSKLDISKNYPNSFILSLDESDILDHRDRADIYNFTVLDNYVPLRKFDIIKTT
ncbi:MAG: glycosyltransferase, partial [Peptostreptococcaceae bacterium]